MIQFEALSMKSRKVILRSVHQAGNIQESCTFKYYIRRIDLDRTFKALAKQGHNVAETLCVNVS